MNDSLYITKEGVLYRKENTIFFQNEEIKKAIPIKNIRDIYCIGKVTVRSGAAYYLMELGIPVHFFGKYGHYRGTLEPKEQYISGDVIINQAKHYLNYVERLIIAREMAMGIKHNILWVLKYYAKKGKKVESNIKKIEEIETIEQENDINRLRSKEGQMWDNFYRAIKEICPKWNFEHRTRRPPTDEINALISYGNTILYAKTVSEIYNTYLHPAISFIHEPRERRYSLALDIADIFKPIIVFRTIFRIVNNRIIKKKDFKKTVGIEMTEGGKKTFINELEKTFQTTVKHPKLKRKVSYQYMIRLEAYKIMKHVINDQKYKSMKAWW